LSIDTIANPGNTSRLIDCRTMAGQQFDFAGTEKMHATLRAGIP
jgi:hypothetical protein